MSPRAVAPAVAAFLAKLPAERRPDVERVREVVLRHLPAGFEEAISRNMLVYQVPLERYSATYNGQPLWYVALASEKSYLSLHLMAVYGSQELAKRLTNGFKAAGRPLNMGKACIRFRTTDDLELDVIGEIVASLSVDRWVQIAEAARSRKK